MRTILLSVLLSLAGAFGLQSYEPIDQIAILSHAEMDGVSIWIVKPCCCQCSCPEVAFDNLQDAIMFIQEVAGRYT